MVEYNFVFIVSKYNVYFWEMIVFILILYFFLKLVVLYEFGFIRVKNLSVVFIWGMVLICIIMFLKYEYLLLIGIESYIRYKYVIKWWVEIYGVRNVYGE